MEAKKADTPQIDAIPDSGEVTGLSVDLLSIDVEAKSERYVGKWVAPIERYCSS